MIFLLTISRFILTDNKDISIYPLLDAQEKTIKACYLTHLEKSSYLKQIKEIYFWQHKPLPIWHSKIYIVDDVFHFDLTLTSSPPDLNTFLTYPNSVIREFAK